MATLQRRSVHFREVVMAWRRANGRINLSTPPETRGTNGMIAEVCVGPGHPDITDFEVNGTNQNGDYAKTPIIDLGGNYDSWRCRVVGGYWWKGVINVLFHHYHGSFFRYLGSRTCNVGYSGVDPAQCLFS